MLKQVIVVEGKQDIVAVNKAVEADCIATGGYALMPRTIEKIQQAYDLRGIIILTDPDSAGERIRRYLIKKFPLAQHAYVSRHEATANNDIGIEQASVATIRMALSKLQCTQFTPSQEFGIADMINDCLTACPEAAKRREQLGAALGIGYANAKTFLVRLNHYGITRSDYQSAVSKLEELR